MLRDDTDTSEQETNLVRACTIGDMISLQIAVTKGALNFNEGFAIACKHGHKALVQRLVKLGISNVNEGFVIACENNHLEIAIYLIDMGASDYEAGTLAAIKCGHIDVVKDMFNRGVRCKQDCAIMASKHGHLEILEYCGNKLYPEPFSYDCFVGACSGGYRKIIERLVFLRVHTQNKEHRPAMRAAIYESHILVVKYLIELGAKVDDETFGDACFAGNSDIVDIIARRYSTNYNLGLSRAAEGGHLRIVKMMVCFGATSVGDAKKLAIINNHNGVVAYLNTRK